MAPKKLPEIINYKGTVLVSRSDATVDVIDSATGRWFVAKNMRAAKWNASVWTRLCNEFKPVQLAHD